MSAGAAVGGAAGAWVGRAAGALAEGADEALGASDEPDFPHPDVANPTTTRKMGAALCTGGSLQRLRGCTKSPDIRSTVGAGAGAGALAEVVEEEALLRRHAADTLFVDLLHDAIELLAIDFVHLLAPDLSPAVEVVT